MTSTTRPTLLSIPREIRDEIYGYLHKQANVSHRCNVSQVIPIRQSIPVYVRCEIAPVVNIQLVHSQLRDEYRSTMISRGFQATVKFCCTLFEKSTANRLNSSEFETMLQVLKHVTILTNATTSWWHRIASDFIASKCTRLVSLRFIVSRGIHGVKKTALTLHHLTVRRGALPDDTTRLKIGKKVTFRRGACGFQVNYLGSSNITLRYKVSHLTMQLYTVEGTGRSPLDRHDAWKTIPARPYPASDLAMFAEEEQKVMVERSSRLLCCRRRKTDFGATGNGCFHDPLAGE